MKVSPIYWTSMALPGEQFGAVEPERLDANQDFAILRGGDHKVLDFENLGPTRFVNHCGFHCGHHSAFQSLCARRVSGGEAVARDLILLVEAAQVTVRSQSQWRSKFFHLAMRRGRKIANGLRVMLLQKIKALVAQIRELGKNKK